VSEIGRRLRFVDVVDAEAAYVCVVSDNDCTAADIVLAWLARVKAECAWAAMARGRGE